MKKLILSLAGISVALIMTAQVPNSFSYQAVIRNADGTVKADESVAIQIDILQGSIDGSSVYLETHNTNTNSFGHVTLEIGKGTTSGDFSSVDWSNGPYFIDVEVNGTSLGATQLLSVPYAMHAQSAEALTGEISYTETQNLDDVLSQNNSANNKTIADLADPVNDQDAATKAYVDALETRLATLEGLVASGDPVVLSSSNSDDDATVTLSVQETIVDGAIDNICFIRVVVVGENVGLTAGDQVNVSLYDDDIVTPDLIWSVQHIVTAAEATQQRVDITYDCSLSLVNIPPELGDQLELFARLVVDKSLCGFMCFQDSPVTPTINVAVSR